MGSYLVCAAGHGLKVILRGANGCMAQELHQPLTSLREMGLKRLLHGHLHVHRSFVRCIFKSGLT